MKIENYTDVQKQIVLDYFKKKYIVWEWNTPQKNIFGGEWGEEYLFKSTFIFYKKKFELVIRALISYENSCSGRKLSVDVHSVWYPSFPWRMWPDQCVRCLLEDTGWSESFCNQVVDKFTDRMIKECKKVRNYMQNVIDIAIAS